MVTKLRSMQKIERKKVRVYETKWMATKLRLMQEESYPKTQLNDSGTTVYISSLNNG